MAEPPAAPENWEVWASASKNLLSSAQTSTSDLFASIEGTDYVHPDSPKLGRSGRPVNVDRGPRQQKKLDDRLEITKTALDADEASGQRCAQILQLLHHERQAKWAALKVVEWRLALRERRPTSELFRDHLQEVLEHEFKILEDSRRILGDRAAEVKIAAEDCEANRVRLARNVRHMICEGNTQVPQPVDSMPASPTSPPPEPEPNAQNEVAAGEGASDPAVKRPAVPTDPDELIKRAPVLHEISMKLYFKGEKLISQQKVICDRANDKVMASFLKRNAENKELKHGLEAQMREMDEGVVIAEKSISRMKKDIEFFGKVELQPKVDSTSAIVARIKASRHELSEDLLRKVVSIRIDDTCRKITPERTSQDPQSMPVAALLEAPVKKEKPKRKVNRQNSSPAFVNVNIDSAASTLSCSVQIIDSAASTATTMLGTRPAGLSDPLKAAAAASMAS